MNSQTDFFVQVLPLKTCRKNLRSDFNKSLINSLIYLMKACEQALDLELYNQVNTKLNKLNSNLKNSGFLSVIHLKLYNEVKKKNVLGVNEICYEFINKNFSVSKIKYINLSNLKFFYRDVIENICSSELDRYNEYYFLSDTNFKNSVIMIEKGLEILKDNFFNFYEEAIDLISEFLILNAKGIQAGTSLDLFGMVHKNYTYRMDKITDILDFIIHEQSHLYLHLIIENNVLVKNPLVKYESPLRNTKRPLIGIYHATFVLSRIIYILLNSQEKNLLPLSEIDYSKSLIEFYIKRFYIGFNILENHAEMTDLGRQIIYSTKNLVESVFELREKIFVKSNFHEKMT